MQETEDKLNKLWARTLYLDRQEPIKPVSGQPNTYRVRFKAYNGLDDVGPEQGRVNIYKQDMTFSRNDRGDVVISHRGPLERPTGYPTMYRRDHLVRWGRTYSALTRGPAGHRRGAPRVGPDKQLSLLRQARAPNGTWWSRTGWGWAAHSDLSHGEGQYPKSEVPLCEGVHVN